VDARGRLDGDSVRAGRARVLPLRLSTEQIERLRALEDTGWALDRFDLFITDTRIRPAIDSATRVADDAGIDLRPLIDAALVRLEVAA
jgi:hypothetical protein